MGINKVMLLGNLGKDPEMRYTNQQLPVCSFSLATGDRRKDSSGNWVDHTEWHNIVAFGKTAELCKNYLKKGRQVFIEGRISTRKWQDKEGKDRWTTEVIATNVQFVGSKGAGTNGSFAGDSASPETSLPAAAAMGALQTADSLASNPDEISFDDDDIPF